LQEHALRLFLAARSGTRDAVPAFVGKPLAQQHPARGWSQAPELQSDAYAIAWAALGVIAVE